MKIASWNVNSVRMRLPLLLQWLEKEQPDVVCLQELKCQDEQFPAAEIKAAGYDGIVSGQKSYNGVAILSKLPIAEIARVLPGEDTDEHARYLEADIGGVRVINVYAPNGNPVESEKFPYKLRWLERLYKRATELQNLEMPFLITGDYNIIPEEIDAKHPEKWVKDALFQPESRAMYRKFLNLGLTDALRMHYPREEALYTFWDYFANSFESDNGIRIDHFLMSPQVADKCTACSIDKTPRAWEKPSDHTPIMITLA